MQQKVSKRQVLREAQNLYEENLKLKKEAKSLLQMMFGVCVKLYKLDPSDETFREEGEKEAMFKPEFLKAIKAAASAPKVDVSETKGKKPLINLGAKKEAQQ